MSSFKPSTPYSTPLMLLNPTKKLVQGVTKKEYDEETAVRIFGTFKTYGGTEQNVNGVYSVVDTANVETWYRPDITAESRVKLGEKVYEVIGEPEDIEQRHQFIKFKVRGVKGGA